MTREEALTEIKERVHVAEYVDSSYVDCVDIEALRMAIKALEQPETQWIPVTERLPEEDKPVFVYLFHDSPHIAWLSEGVWYTDDFIIDKDDEPTAWMPLPEPYREEGGM